MGFLNYNLGSADYLYETLERGICDLNRLCSLSPDSKLVWIISQNIYEFLRTDYPWLLVPSKSGNEKLCGLEIMIIEDERAVNTLVPAFYDHIPSAVVPPPYFYVEEESIGEKHRVFIREDNLRFYPAGEDAVFAADYVHRFTERTSNIRGDIGKSTGILIADEFADSGIDQPDGESLIDEFLASFAQKKE